MRRAELLQEIRQMRFKEAYGGWHSRRLTQFEAAHLLGVCERTFRRYVSRYEEDGLEWLLDKRLSQVSHRQAPVDEVLALIEQYEKRHHGWNVRHFHAWYRRDGGTRSYSWVKSRLQESGLVAKAFGRGKHRKRRERAAWPGMMLHQDGSTHEWGPGIQWDLIVTMGDAANEHYSMFFVEQEGTASSFRGVREVIEKRGLFASLCAVPGAQPGAVRAEDGDDPACVRTPSGQAIRNAGQHSIQAGVSPSNPTDNARPPPSPINGA